ncbi:hypothetical protein S7711_00926 [Stachybotrys chartarum IBT 7711]|uniref:Uncharacterized protein n=1 Tax=Stachybotrys chartarum (strain CBS 109288 / IBT 7711) TaxID=1280523 RepID=A0A084B0M5_STACB|nr:hypothetical protein S7711_00926 [Stachybotrys chartarum IBT 7711]
MLQRSSVQCPRTASQPWPASQVGVWITDLMLDRAIERWQRAALQHRRRRLNTYAGPLESRRRLGKRHLTGFVPSASTQPTLWPCIFIPNEYSWQWRPPTSPEAREKKKQETDKEPLSLSRLFNILLDWLDDSAPVKPFLEPPTTELITTRPQALAYASMLHSEVLRLRRELAGLPLPLESATLDRLCEECCSGIEQRIHNGQFTAKSVAFAFHPLSCQLQDRLQHRAVRGRIDDFIRRGMLLALAESHSLLDLDLSFVLWYTFFQGFGTIKGNWSKNEALLFCKTIQMAPTYVRSELPIKHLCRGMMCALQAFSRDQSPSEDIGAAMHLGATFGSLHVSEQMELENALRPTLQRAPNARLRYFWVLAKAADPGTPMGTSVSHHRQKLPSAQVLLVVLVRLVSTGTISEEEAKRIITQDTPWVWVVRGIMQSEKRDTSLEELFFIVKKLGYPRYLHSVVRLAWHPDMPLSLLQRQVFDQDDHVLALMMWRGVSNGLKNDHMGQRRPEWHWKAWSRFVERMISDRQPDSRKLRRMWEVMDLSPYRPPADGQAYPDAAEKAQFLDHIAGWLVGARHLSDRVVLRHVGRCAWLQRVLQGKMSDQVLGHLTEVITRDLEDGKHGWRPRLEWLVRLVDETKGELEADKVLRLLEGWREVIRQNRPDLKIHRLRRSGG